MTSLLSTLKLYHVSKKNSKEDPKSKEIPFF
ncbi:hypothetical protein MGAS9429_Spy1081 [Streptococcus pyogenes MGAS9429]|uniref:Uncharacterized protein n=1 Tax=Streptococcus pyogenes serotype M12 (strain MGAS9429) TaxID=370551 RepID=Q1JLF1_STRPC|nr:hypothetical protein MGAS9429_Spy1081 [Streptococcus pyogenes MGAS9429]